MEAVKFTLKGRQAFFKNPEVNTFYYPTYGHIHKVALLGIFGAILGYGGYGRIEAQKEEYPEFYRRLMHLKVAIIPKECKAAYFPKKIQCFNNSVGYASQEQGGNLIVKEQWLEHPCWDIYVLIEDENSEKLAECLEKHQCMYIPYLGKNDHQADILNVQRVQLCRNDEEEKVIQGFIPGEDNQVDSYAEVEEIFKYVEYLPVRLSRELNTYQLERFMCTNLPVESCSYPVYSIIETGENIVLF